MKTETYQMHTKAADFYPPSVNLKFDGFRNALLPLVKFVHFGQKSTNRTLLRSNNYLGDVGEGSEVQYRISHKVAILLKNV